MSRGKMRGSMPLMFKRKRRIRKLVIGLFKIRINIGFNRVIVDLLL
jgi:hypothetical protein